MGDGTGRSGFLCVFGGLLGGVAGTVDGGDVVEGWYEKGVQVER